MPLATELRIADPDAFYAELLRLHAGLAVEESLKLDAKLILLLANQIGDAAILAEILAIVRDGKTDSGSGT